MLPESLTINQNWTDKETGLPDGGISIGIGFTISWQRGALNEAGRNGAFLLEVLHSCLHQLEYFQNSKFACQENADAVEQLKGAIASLESRRTKRDTQGILGTHQVG